MPQYVYECEKCGDSHTVIHGMKEDPRVPCTVAKCTGTCFRVIQPVRALVRGNCYLNKADCKRQAALSNLKEHDPYSKFRQPGEKEELISNLKHGNKKKKVFKVK